MYPNLRAEMARTQTTAQALAKMLGINNSTLSQKMKGKYAFTLDEAFAVKKSLGTALPLEQLFEIDEA